jgi:hypothetical protein
VLIATYTELRIRRVADIGKRFDYWLESEEEGEEGGLEVSGTTVADGLERLHREKVQQLLANPSDIGGYVVVVNFATREAILSFNPLTEGEP